MAGSLGDGYRGRRSPHTPHETFEGLTVLRAVKVGGNDVTEAGLRASRDPHCCFFLSWLRKTWWTNQMPSCYMSWVRECEPCCTPTSGAPQDFSSLSHTWSVALLSQVKPTVLNTRIIGTGSLMCTQIIHSILTSLLKVKCVILFLFCFFFLNQRIRRAGWTSLTPSTLTTVSSSRKPSSVGRNHQLSHTETSGTEKTSLRGLIINLGSHLLHK